MAQKHFPPQSPTGQLGFEAELFKAADKLRGNMEPSDYKHVALEVRIFPFFRTIFSPKCSKWKRKI